MGEEIIKMVLEKIQVQLELLSNNFNTKMKTAQNSLKSLNASLRKQQRALTPLQNNVNTMSKNLAVYKSRITKATDAQKWSIKKQQQALALGRREAGVITNSIRRTQRKIDKQNDNVKSITKGFNREKGILEKTKSMQEKQNSIFKQKEAMFKSLDKKVEQSSSFQRKTNDAVVGSFMKRRKDDSNDQKKAIEVSKDSQAAGMGFFDVMRLNGDQFKELGKRQNLMTKRMGKGAFATRKFMHGLKGFKMEMLGVMFFGMAMNRMFMGLTKTSTNWLGVFEILSIALGILFLPLAKKLLVWAIKFLKWVTKLTPAQKKFWNQFVFGAIVVGSLLAVFGTLMLGLGSLMLAFSFLFTPIGLVIGALVTLGGFWFLRNMFSDMGSAVESVENKLISFGVSAEVLDTIKDKVIELASNMSTMKDKWIGIGTDVASGLITGIQNYFKDNPMIVVGAIAGALLGGPASVAMGAAIGSLFKNVKIEDITALLDSGLKILDELIQGIMDNLDALDDTVTAIAEKLTTFVIQHIDEFIEIGFTIGAAIAGGIGKSVNSWFNKVDRFISDKTGFKTLDIIYEDSQAQISANKNRSTGNQGTSSLLNPSPFDGREVNITNIFNGAGTEEIKRFVEQNQSEMVSQMELNRS